MTVIGIRLGKAINDRQDFDIWWLTRSMCCGTPPLECDACTRTYKKTGWLQRHYLKTGHWRQKSPQTYDVTIAKRKVD